MHAMALARRDIDLDGDVDHTDSRTISGSFSGITPGRGALSASGVASKNGSAGYEFSAVDTCYRLLSLVHSSGIGRFFQYRLIAYHEPETVR